MATEQPPTEPAEGTRPVLLGTHAFPEKLALPEQLDLLHLIEERGASIIRSVPSRTDEGVIQLVMAALAGGKMMWRIVDAGDADMARRLQARCGGDKALFKRELARYALETHRSLSTLYRNVQVHQLIEENAERLEDEGVLGVLTDQSYYREALSAPPGKQADALVEMARAKADDDTYGTRAARQTVTRLKIAEPRESYGPQAVGQFALLYGRARLRPLDVPESVGRLGLPDSSIFLEVEPRLVDYAIALIVAAGYRYATCAQIMGSSTPDAYLGLSRSLLIVGERGSGVRPAASPIHPLEAEHVVTWLDLVYPDVQPKLWLWHDPHTSLPTGWIGAPMLEAWPHG